MTRMQQPQTGELVRCPACKGIIEVPYGWRTLGGQGEQTCEHCGSTLVISHGIIYARPDRVGGFGWGTSNGTLQKHEGLNTKDLTEEDRKKIAELTCELITKNWKNIIEAPTTNRPCFDREMFDGTGMKETVPLNEISLTLKFSLPLVMDKK